MLSCFRPSLSAICYPLITPRMEGFDNISRHVRGARGSGDGASLAWMGNSPVQSCWMILRQRRLFFPRDVPEERGEPSEMALRRTFDFRPIVEIWPLTEAGKASTHPFAIQRGHGEGKSLIVAEATLSPAFYYLLVWISSRPTSRHQVRLNPAPYSTRGFNSLNSRFSLLVAISVSKPRQLHHRLLGIWR